jgi:acyl-CoA synthetase (AMP-forming)/AMP-acid ligase II
MNILSALRGWATESPNKDAWIFLNDKGDPVESYTYKATIQRVRIILNKN